MHKSIATPIGFKPALIEDSGETLIIFTVFQEELTQTYKTAHTVHR